MKGELLGLKLSQVPINQGCPLGTAQGSKLQTKPGMSQVQSWENQ